MSDYEPQIIELEPEKAPRTTAIILLICGLMGVSFLMVNVFFTGDDPLQTETWPEQDDGSVQERGNILPNVWRARGRGDDEEEDVDDQITSRKVPKPPTTNAYTIPGTEQYMKRPTIVTTPPPTVKPPTMAKPGAPGGTNAGTPGAPGTGAPGSTPGK